MLSSPFPWFGGKSRAAGLIWQRLDDCKNYVEPFCGSIAVLLGREWPNNKTRVETVNDRTGLLVNFWRSYRGSPDEVHHAFLSEMMNDVKVKPETVNDLDPMVINFWRSLQADYQTVVNHIDWPVSELDLHARHDFLRKQISNLRTNLRDDPLFFNPMIAGWWCWGIACWIADGWCRESQEASEKIPHLTSPGQGINRALYIGYGEKPSANGACQDRKDVLTRYLKQFSDRLRYVRVTCGDWTRVLEPSVTEHLGITGIVLDPPYSEATNAQASVYGELSDSNLSVAVNKWGVTNGPNKKLRIAICGYEGEHNNLELLGWEKVEWKAQGGYGAVSGNKNCEKERIWFSPACIKPEDKAKPLSLGLEE
jgi:DNA adenine methylase